MLYFPLLPFAGLPSLGTFCINVSLYLANLKDREWAGSGGQGFVPFTSCEPAGSHQHCLFGLEINLIIHISLLYNMYHSCYSSLTRSQNTINHPEQNPGSCNKKVLKPQKRKPEEVPPQSRQISITL